MKTSKALYKSILTAFIAIALAVAMLAVVMPGNRVSAAKTIKTGDVWSSSGSTKVTGTADGTKMTLEEGYTGSVSLKNTLYMANSLVGADGKVAAKATSDTAKNDFDIVFQFVNADFESMQLTLSVTNADSTKTEKVKHVFTFMNQDGKLAIKFSDGYDEKKDDTVEEHVLANSAFSGKDITLSYKNTGSGDNAGKKFIVAQGNESVEFKPKYEILEGEQPDPVNDVVNMNAAYAAEGTLSMEIQEVTEDKTAEVLVKSVNGQQLAVDDSGLFKTSANTVIVPDYFKMAKNKEANDTNDEPKYLVGQDSDNQMYIRTYSVLRSSLEKETKVAFKAKGEEEFTDLDLPSTDKSSWSTVGKEGEYKVTYSVLKDGKTDDKAEQEFTFTTVAVDANEKPVIDLTNYAETYKKLFERCAAGKEYRMPAPEVTSPDGLNNKYNVTFSIWYKSPSSTAWTKADGLAFTPSAEGRYVVSFQAEDACHRKSVPGVDPGDGGVWVPQTVEIEFSDLDAPTITISSFPKKGYLDQEMTVPAGSASDTVDSSLSPKRTMEYLGETASEDWQAKEGEDLTEEISGNRYTPEKLGFYRVTYTVTDKAGHTTTEYYQFEVVKYTGTTPNPTWTFNWTPWTITFVCIGSASLLGILVLLFIKPKKKETEETEEK